MIKLSKFQSFFSYMGSCTFAAASSLAVVGALTISLGVFSPLVNAQARVVEVGANQNPAPVSNSNNNDVMMNLYFQLEALQVEVQTLRGIIEEQSYSISRMETEQRDRYLDLDRRISSGGVSSSLPNTSVNPPSVNPIAGTGNDNTNVASLSPQSSQANPRPSNSIPANSTSSVASNVATGPASEQDIYRSALNLLLEDSKYEESIVMFQQYIEAYPAGRLLTNAHYWQGEALLLTQNYSRAIEVFITILEEYPQDPKAPGAMLKLGVAYDQLGNTSQAIQVWQQISEQYPGSLTEIRAADDYLLRSGN